MRYARRTLLACTLMASALTAQAQQAPIKIASRVEPSGTGATAGTNFRNNIEMKHLANGLESYLATSPDNHLFHICTEDDLRQARALGVHRPESLSSDGFVHLARSTQVIQVLQHFFVGKQGLVLLAIDPARLTHALKFEAAAAVGSQPGAGDKGESFPHVYGPLNIEAIVDAVRLPAAAIP